MLAADGSADLAPVAAALKRWDGAYRPESVAPTIFQAIWEHWRDRVAAARLPARAAALPDARFQASAIARRLLEGDDPGWWPDPATDTAAELRAAAHAALAASPPSPAPSPPPPPTDQHPAPSTQHPAPAGAGAASTASPSRIRSATDPACAG